MKRKKVTHGEVVRAEVRRLRRTVPFQPFTLTLTDGTLLHVRSPFNIAFDPGDKRRRGSMEFTLVSREGTYDGSFEKVSIIAVLENGAGSSLVKTEKGR